MVQEVMATSRSITASLCLLEGIRPQTDLVPVCSNCHRMIHRRRPWLSVEQLRQLVRSCGDQAPRLTRCQGRGRDQADLDLRRRCRSD